MEAARPDALDPGDPARPFAVRGTQQLAVRGPGGRQDTFIFQAGNDVGKSPAAIGVHCRGIEYIGPGSQQDGTDIQPGAFHGIVGHDGPRAADPDQSFHVPALFHVDRKSIRGRLRIAHTGRRPVIQPRRKTHAFGKLLETFPARRALVKVDVPRRGRQSHFEVSGFAFDRGELRHGKEFDARFTPIFGKMGRQGAEITVVGWESAVQTGHKPAQRVIFIDQHHISACFRQIKRGPYAANATANYEDFIVRWSNIFVWHYSTLSLFSTHT